MNVGNHWHRDIRAFLDALASPNFCWVDNSRFKYVNIRLDTRNGNFLIYDENKKRVDIEQVLWQYSAETPEPPKSIHYPEEET